MLEVKALQDGVSGTSWRRDRFVFTIPSMVLTIFYVYNNTIHNLTIIEAGGTTGTTQEKGHTTGRVGTIA